MGKAKVMDTKKELKITLSNEYGFSAVIILPFVQGAIVQLKIIEFFDKLMSELNESPGSESSAPETSETVSAPLDRDWETLSQPKTHIH